MARIIEDLAEIAAVLRSHEGVRCVTTRGDDSCIAIKAGDIDQTDLPSVDELRALAKKRGVAWNEEESPALTQRYWGSDERVDSHGDIVRQKWDFARFERNPVMPFSHDTTRPPVGSHLDWKVVRRVEKRKPAYDGQALWTIGLFASSDVSEEAAGIGRLARAGILRGASVGFVPKRISVIEDAKEREELGLGRWGVVFEESTLLELSPTPIPANPAAYSIMALAKSRGLFTVGDVATLRDTYRLGCALRGARDEWVEIDARVRSMASTLFPRAEIRRAVDIDAPVEPVVERTEQVALPADIVERLQRIEERQERIEATVNEVATGVGQKLDDVRDMLEGISAERSIGGSGGEREPAGAELDAEAVDAIGRALDERWSK